MLYSFMASAQPKDDKEIRILNNEHYILILCSYQYNNPWATSIGKKIQQQLEKENPELIFRIVYASLDIQQSMLASRLNMQKAFSQARLTPTVLIPRVLVLIGDESWMLYRIMNLRGKWEKVPVVLCGSHHEILKDYATFFREHSFKDSLTTPLKQSLGTLKVTGVLQKNNGDRTATFIRHTFPALKEIVYISKGNYNDEYEWHQQRQSLLSAFPQVKLSYFNSNQTLPDSICGYVNRLSPDSAVLLFNSEPSFSAALNLPAFSLCDQKTDNDHIVGGYYASSDQLACQTAEMVMQIYNGTPIEELPFQYADNQHFYLNAQASFLPEPNWQESDLPGLVYYNIPPPFIIRHLRPIGLITLAISLLVTGILISFRTRKYQHHIQHLLVKYKNLHEKFQIIYDNIPISLLIFNEKGELEYKNPTGKKLLNHWFGESPRDPNLFNDQFLHSRLQEKIRRQENINQIFPMQDGTYQMRPSGIYLENSDYYRIVTRYIPDEYSNTGNILMILIDNTDIYREKIANKKIRGVFDFAMDKAMIGVAEYNLYDKKGTASDSWRKHMGMTDKQDYSFSAALQRVSGDDREAIQQFYQQASRGECDYFVKDVKVIHEDGSVHYLREQIKVMEYQPENQRIWITELNQNIDKEKEYTTELQAAIHKAKEAERLKNTFIANMSHEIRSPLNAIIGFSNLISMTEDIEARKEMIHYIEENNELLLRQVNDIVELSKIESGSMTFIMSETNVNDLFQDITVSHQFKAAQKNLKIECCCPVENLYILTDKVRIRQAITNLLSNAVRYTEQGHITVGYKLEKNMLYTYVTDTGIGIPRQDIPKVFDRFFRAHKIHHGFGLGLSIARVIVEGLKGRMGVESEEGKGSTFWFRLPVRIVYKNIQESPQETSASPTGIQHSGPQPHILVVEEDESNFLLIRFMLKDICRISHARNGGEAVQMLRETHQDLILMDIKMPQKNGYQATKEIRSLSPQIPIIATTAFAFSKDENQALTNGFNAYLPKPLDKPMLLKTIYHWLNNAN